MFYSTSYSRLWCVGAVVSAEPSASLYSKIPPRIKSHPSHKDSARRGGVVFQVA